MDKSQTGQNNKRLGGKGKMSIAEQYRENHREMMQREKQEESWPMTILNLFGFVAVAMIWLALLMVWM